MKSNVERCAYHRQVLRELGQHVFILKLQGFLFFGTANALLEQIRARVVDAKLPEVRYIVLDFRRVVGLDSSAVISFVKCRQIAEARGSTLLLTSISERMRRQFELGGLFVGEGAVQTFPDLDHGLEWCEDQLLQSELITHMLVPITLKAQLREGGFEQAHVDCLVAYLKKMEVKAGEYLIRQGDQARDLYFIERGDVSVHLELEDGKRMRLQTLGLGTIVGESGLYLGKTRTASVVADSPTVAYRLSQEALFKIRENEPELAAVFYEFLLRLVAERLAATNRTLAAMLR
jgi:SulP family sulfate permease